VAKAKKIGRVPKKAAVAAPVAAAPKPRWKIVCGSCFALLAVLLLVYTYSMTSEYVFNDTINYGAVNSLKDKSSFWLNLLVSGLGNPLSLPWLKATYAWDSSSFGFAPGWSHAVNICLHLFSCLYFYLFTFRLAWRLNLDGKIKIDPYYLSAAATALLALHPLVTGSVAYVSGREGVLGAVNYFLAMNFFLLGFYEERLGYALVAYLCFFLFAAIGIISNAQCLTLPFFGAGLIVLLRPSETVSKEWLIDRSWEIISLLFVGICACYVMTTGVPTKVDSSFGMVPLLSQVYWATQFKMILMYYLRCALIPFGMSVYPPFIATNGFADFGAILGAISVVGIGVAGFMQKQPLIKIGTFMFLLTLCPWIYLPQGEIAADARFYLPLAGLCLVAATFIAQEAMKNFKRTAIGFGVLMIAFTSLTVWREVEWSTDKRLWRAEIKTNPHNARAHAYLAAYLLEHDKPEQCKKELSEALAIKNDDFLAHVINGFYLFQTRDYKQSSKELETALTIATQCKMSEEELAVYRAQLAKALARDNNLPAAYTQATLASKYITTDPFLYLLNGKSLLEQHESVRALKALEDGVKLEPTNGDFLIPIAQAALDSGLPQVLQHAYAASARAMKVRPGLKTSKLYIRACLELGRPEEARDRLELLKKTDPDDAEIEWLAYGYAKQAGRAAEAEAYRKKAMALDPGIEKRIRLYLRKDLSQLVVPDAVKRPGETGNSVMTVPKPETQRQVTSGTAESAARDSGSKSTAAENGAPGSAGKSTAADAGAPGFAEKSTQAGTGAPGAATKSDKAKPVVKPVTTVSPAPNVESIKPLAIESPAPENAGHR
jgi:tetratricopeptide (TPR) repeat protein